MGSHPITKLNRCIHTTATLLWTAFSPFKKEYSFQPTANLWPHRVKDMLPLWYTLINLFWLSCHSLSWFRNFLSLVPWRLCFGRVLCSSYGDPAFNACSVFRIVSVFNMGVYSYFNIYVFYNMAGANIKKLNNDIFARCLFQWYQNVI